MCCTWSQNIILNSKPLECVHDLKYLGSRVCNAETSMAEILSLLAIVLSNMTDLDKI